MSQSDKMQYCFRARAIDVVHSKAREMKMRESERGSQTDGFGVSEKVQETRRE